MDDKAELDQGEIDGLGALLPHEVALIRHFRKANSSDQHSIAEYAELCAQGWPAFPKAGELKPDPSDELIHLHDLSFDFEGYFARDHDKMPEDEKAEWKARIYGMFCRDVVRSGGDMRRVRFWTANYVAERLIFALGGAPWQDIMGLPWDEPTPFRTKQGERALNIYIDIVNALRESPNANVTDLISEGAKKHHVSYETARSNYYDMKKAIESKTGMPAKFLKNDT